MPIKTKGDHVNDALQKLRIGGLTTNPEPEEISDCLLVLEDMMSELDSRNICTSFQFEDDPDPSTESGIDPAYNNAVAYNLAMRMLDYFGKEATATLARQATQSMSNWSARAAKVRQINAPRRQPRGSGNNFRWPVWSRYYRDEASAPISCDTQQIKQGQVENYGINLDGYLSDGETISSYTYEASAGLTVTQEVLTDDLWAYTVQAGDTATDYQAVNLSVVTSDGREQTFTANFNVVVVPDLG